MTNALQKLIAGAALALCITIPAFAGTPVILKGEVLAEGPVTLGDIFEGAGGRAGVIVAPAPPAGGSVMIDSTTLQRIAIANGLTWTNDRGLRRIIVRAGAPAALAADVRGAPTSAKGVEVLTWTRSITAGELITAEDLAYTVMPAQPAGSPRDAEALIGKVAKRPLRTGGAAKAADVGQPQVVKKDDVITVVFNANGVSLSLQAKAMGSAAVGESLTVTNMQSNKIFQAVAAGPGRAVVGPEAEAIRTQSLALR